MGSKKNRGRRFCAYCGQAVADAINEHVTFRKLLETQHRQNVPQVPSCRPCNTEKSKLKKRVSYYWLLAQAKLRPSEFEKKFAKTHPEVKRIKQTTRTIMTSDGYLTFAIGDESLIDLIQGWLDYLVRGLQSFYFQQLVLPSHRSRFLPNTRDLNVLNPVSNLYIKKSLVDL